VVASRKVSAFNAFFWDAAEETFQSTHTLPPTARETHSFPRQGYSSL